MMLFSAFFRYMKRGAVLLAPRLWPAWMVVALLTACASPITTRVTRFNQWPADANGSTFSFLDRRNTAHELEQATDESHVQVALERLGFKPAPSGQAGRLQVDVGAAHRSEEKTYLQPVYQNSYVFLPPYRDAAGRIFPGVWAPDPFGPRYVGDRPVSQTLQISSLQLRMLDTKPDATGTPPPNQPRTVFEAQAVYEGASGDLPVVMPYLVRAVFDDFPGQNGQVRIVKFDRETGTLLKR